MARDLGPDGETPPLPGCCSAGAAALARAERLGGPGAERWAQPAGAQTLALDLIVPGMHCAGCMNAVERGLAALPGVASARVNLSLRRAHVLYDPKQATAEDVIARIEAVGYDARPFDARAMADIDRDAQGRDLLARLGVAGFAAMNVMLLSVSVWSGAEAATRDFLHWVSALIALPAVAFSGMPFFRSALRSLRAGRLGMDVPISLAVILASGVSLYETALGGRHAYFDAGIMLVFFLLIGRYLDHRTRAAARSAAAELGALSARSATVIGEDGARRVIAAEDLAAGMLVAVAAGERIPADGTVESGMSDLDRSLVTGESTPDAVGPGAAVHAGMLNLTGPLRIRATATGEATLLADIARMVAAAEAGRGRYDRWADRAARLYSPGVHVVAAAALVGWLAATGDWRLAITIASAVLIITCPCALGLAVPAVHAVASGRLLRRGVFLKDGGALERLSDIDTVVFDKTGTLTDGRPVLEQTPVPGDPAWAIAAGLAVASTHPIARALAEAATAAGITPAPIEDLREHPGLGIEGTAAGVSVRLGSAAFVGGEPPGGTCVLLRIGDGIPLAYSVTETLREDAPEICEALRGLGLKLVLLSGDAENPVARVAEATGIFQFGSHMSPSAKLAELERMKREGARVLMVGDGINDAPALAAAQVSISPVTAADVSRAAADMVFTGSRLAPVLFAIRTARTARIRAVQNFALAGIYNVAAIPLALAGLVTPLIAALAMSGSSIVVTLNAIRR